MPHRRLKDIVAGQDLLYVAPSATVREAADRMRERHVGATLVLDEGVLRGIFTERDLLQRVVASGCSPETTFVAQVMTHDPYSLNGDRQGIEAMRIMRELIPSRASTMLPASDRLILASSSSSAPDSMNLSNSVLIF